MTSEAQKRASAKYDSTKARVTIRFTPEEKKEVCIKAAKAGKSVNTWLRDLALNAK